MNTDHERDLKRHEKTIESLCKSLDSMRRDYRALEASITDLQCRSMKMNLIFTGIGGETKDEDTEDKLRAFLYYELASTSIFNSETSTGLADTFTVKIDRLLPDFSTKKT